MKKILGMMSAVILLGASTVFAVPAVLDDQTITFDPLPKRSVGAAPFTLDATASSALTVTFVSDTVGVCTVSGTTVTLVTTGTCTIRASQVGDGSYNPAPEVTQSFAVEAQPSTVYVDPSYSTTYGETTAGDHMAGFDAFTTIAAGMVAVAVNGTVQVTGAHTGDISITKDLSLEGASGAVITGKVQIEASGVQIHRLEITNPDGNFGIFINGVGNVTIDENSIHHIGTGSATGNSYGVYFQDGSSDVADISITDNTIQNIGSASNGSNGGIGIGDSTGATLVTEVTVSGNTISSITANPASSGGKGAYGIIWNHARGNTGNEGTVSGTISGNSITGLSGRWAHAIGLEGGTPNTYVYDNTISNLTSTKAPQDAVAFMIESNTEVNDEEPRLYINDNDVDLGTVAWGVINLMSGTVDATNNFWRTTTPAAQMFGPAASPATNVDISPFKATTDGTVMGLELITIGATSTAAVDFFKCPRFLNFSCSIPSGTQVSGPVGWDGLFTLPVATTTYTLIPSSGHSATAVDVIALGSNYAPLTFNNPIQLKFIGHAGKLVGWSKNGVFTEITTVCPPGDFVLPEGGDCKKDGVGEDAGNLYVFTRHATSFIVYTQTANPVVTSSGGGNGPISGSLGGGGTGGGSIIPTFGQVLGASTSTTGTTTTAVSTTTTVIVTDKGVCTPLITADLRMGRNNPVAEVKKLQEFLNKELGLSIPVTGYFGIQTDRAVKQLQEKYRNEILGPAGAPEPTGLVLQYTRALINARNCMTI